LRDGETAFSEFASGLQIPACDIEQPQSVQNGAELRGFTDPPAQVAGARVDPLDLWRRMALGGDHWTAQGNVQAEFLLGTLARARQGREQLQRLAEMGNSFEIGRAADRALTRILPPQDGMARQPRLRVVMGNQLRLGLSDLSKPRLQDVGDLLVVLLTSAFEQRLVGSILN